MDLERLVAAALAEDVGTGDVTSAVTVPEDAAGAAALAAREHGVVAGLDAAGAVFTAAGTQSRFTACTLDGQRVEPGTVLATVTGPARVLLAAERTALNLLSHLSGVATTTRRYVDAVAGSGCVVRDTRKTIPGLRALQKAAVVAGGGANHRFGLHDGLLVKDNHVAAAGGTGPATRAALAGAGGLPVQVEVDDLAQLDEALAAGARCVLLDNFSLPDLRAGVARCRRETDEVFVEASGRVSLARVAAIAATGVDAVAVGALTHSVTALDIALDWHMPMALDWHTSTALDWRS